ncbi:Transposase IS4 [Popillia japonica]|uniref:Transposase IS4 n=1 Tax=Popillia japonica TaxID=7064 RepID=A0AAW1J1S1_POPJA
MADLPCDFTWRGGVSLEEALNIAYEDDIDIEEIYIEPPDSNVLTDEDSGKEDDGGYCELPGRDFYWDSQEDMKNHMVTQATRRDRFRQILRYLHCTDNTKSNESDKLWKLRRMDMIKEKFLQNWVSEQNLDVDESMIKYFERHSCKQFIRGKPIRFGYKM